MRRKTKEEIVPTPAEPEVAETTASDQSITRSMSGPNTNERLGLAPNFPKGQYATARGITREDR